MSKKDEPKRGRGQPTKFNENLSNIIFELAKKGMTDREMAEILGIGLSTLNLWKNKHPEFLDALKESKNAADGLVEAALFQNAVIGGNVTAQIFWLKNRQPEDWRDKVHTELTGADGKPIAPQQITLIIPENFRNKKKSE